MTKRILQWLKGHYLNNKSSINYIKWFPNTKEKKWSKAEIKATTTLIKRSLKNSLMSEGHTYIPEPNLEVLPLEVFIFFLLKILDNDVRSNDAIRSIIAFGIRWQVKVQ